MTGNSCIPMTHAIAYLRSPSWTRIAPSCNHVACRFRLFPTFRLYLDSLVQPCTVWFCLFSFSYLIRLTPVSFFSAISPSGCICNTAFLYKPVRYSRIQLVWILTRFPPFFFWVQQALRPTNMGHVCGAGHSALPELLRPHPEPRLYGFPWFHISWHA